MHLINTDVLYEKFSVMDIPVYFRRKGIPHELKGYRFYSEGMEEDPSYLYICPFEDQQFTQKAAAIYCGSWPIHELQEMPDLPEFFVSPSVPERRLINILEEIFEDARGIEEKVRLAQISASPLFEICEAAVDWFHADCFIHDDQFFIRAYDRRIDIASNPEFVYSRQYKAYIQAPEILNDFRVDPAYERTLKKTGLQLWVDTTTDVRCLYINQFRYNEYLGRMIIRLTELTAGFSYAAEYFNQAIITALSAESVSGSAVADPLSHLLQNFAENEAVTEKLTTDAAEAAGWPLTGRFLCGMIRFYKNQLNTYMIRSVCLSIREKIPGCSLHYSGNRIYILVNINASRLSASDIRMKMAEQIRESLLKAALSDPFSSLKDFPLYMQQANACLDYMVQTNMTDWFCEFRQIAVPFWLRNGASALSEDAVIAAGLRELQQFDRENDTDLYDTLKVYLVSERNVTLTSQVLHIHRSTLPHRLERIREITGYNLNSAKTRLHLLMSFALLRDTE